jgi:hypothetical protein
MPLRRDAGEKSNRDALQLPIGERYFDFAMRPLRISTAR